MTHATDKRILMALTRFEIGGAETHVLELSLELQRMGYHVVVASNGGVYEQNLQEAGIRHVKIPMHSKTPIHMAQSLHMLRKVICEERINIVHAHGRIPAFLCGILNKFVKFTFVTTAHWVFDTSHGLKYVSNWGKKVMAVSEDIKTYLMDNYHTHPTDIYVTINGIDTGKFCKTADTESIISEFSLSRESKKIVYISRMDSDRAQLAFQLVEIAPEIVKICPDIEIVIVGSGDVFDELQEKTETMNQQLGSRKIILTGGRTDIYKFAALGDIFVGVSRSALEAMACEKPVIVAGNEGYIGIFDEDKLSCAVETNFCCRGLAPSSCDKLLADVKALLTNAAEENARLGQFGRQVILNSYSLSKMAQDCVKMYTAATDTKKWDAVVSGYYGFQNAGDESLLYAMIQNLREQKDDVRLLVLSKDPKATEATYGVRAINRYNFLKIRTAFKQSHLLIFGGGSLIQDVTSSKSLWYYLAVVKQAIKLSVPVIFYANGIGPICKEKNQKKVLKVLNKVDKISLREPNSYYELKRMGVDMDRVIITADPALTICGVTREEAAKLLEKEGVPTDARLLGISIRNWKSCKPSYWNQLARGITQICRQFNLVPVWIPLKHPDDIIISQMVAEKVEVPGYVLTNYYSAKELVGIVGSCDLMIAMRLHSMIYAAGAGVPAIGLSYDPKVSSFAKYIGVNTTLHLENLTDEGLASMARDILRNRETIQSILCEKVLELKQKAMENVSMAMELMDQTNEQSGDENAADGH